MPTLHLPKDIVIPEDMQPPPKDKKSLQKIIFADKMSRYDVQDGKSVQQPASPIIIKPEPKWESGNEIGCSYENNSSTMPHGTSEHIKLLETNHLSTVKRESQDNWDGAPVVSMEMTIKPETKDHPSVEGDFSQETGVKQENIPDDDKDQLNDVKRDFDEINFSDFVGVPGTADMAGSNYTVKLDTLQASCTNMGSSSQQRASYVKQESDIMDSFNVVQDKNSWTGSIPANTEVPDGVSVSDDSNKELDKDIIAKLNIIKEDIIDLHNVTNENEVTKTENPSDNDMSCDTQIGEAWIETKSEVQDEFLNDNKLLEFNDQPFETPKNDVVKLLETGRATFAKLKRSTTGDEVVAVEVGNKNSSAKNRPSTSTSGFIPSDMEHVIKHDKREVCNIEDGSENDADLVDIKMEPSDHVESPGSAVKSKTKRENPEKVVDDGSKSGDQVTESTIFKEEWQKAQQTNKPVTCGRYVNLLWWHALFELTCANAPIYILV